jgi:hypothetical protein
MAKIIIHAYTQDENNPHLPKYADLFVALKDTLGGYVGWIDCVDTTNKTTFEYEDKLEEEE